MMGVVGACEAVEKGDINEVEMLWEFEMVVLKRKNIQHCEWLGQFEE